MIYIIILGLLAGYREVQILCDRGSWYYLNFRQWFWFTNQAGKWKDFDSFHVSNGLYALVLCLFVATCTKLSFISALCPIEIGKYGAILIDIVFYWWLYMYVRNIMMHVILPYKPQWKYALPIHFWIEYKASWF